MKGMIRNAAQVKQVIDFVGTEYGNIHPSDIDAVLEFDNEVLIIFEIKRQGCHIEKGQALLLERLVNNWKGKAIVLKGEHTYQDDEVIILNECAFTWCYYAGKWRRPKVALTIGNALGLLARKWDIKKMGI